MKNQEGYDTWSDTYDQDINKTRDLEAKALRDTLSVYRFNNVLEAGCGTGKNTIWLIEKAKTITAIDFSEKMLEQAREKIKSEKVIFLKADITEEWNFGDIKFDLIVFSLVLEHIENLTSILNKAKSCLSKEGCIYVGELHPYKQYDGSKARFIKEGVTSVLECYKHDISEYISAGKNNNLIVTDIKEFFDDEINSIPRIIVFLFKNAG